jgi:D-alanyl-D-alanine carboxypeptidase/D-alanyl-D-alanine-endopeptidase (penicillin-binding protein 4)
MQLCFKSFAGLVFGLCLFLPPAWAQESRALPPEVAAALAGAGLPLDALTLLVVAADGKAPPRLSHRAEVPVNPASVIKLLTTYVALDQLGPAFRWKTPVYVVGKVRHQTLYGNVYIQGQGDPKLVIENLWLLLRRVQGLGIHTIVGDVVLDNSAFVTEASDAGDFDGERLRPYNAAPDALLLNFKSVLMTFVPDVEQRRAHVSFDPPLAGVNMQPTVPLSAGACNDYRSDLRADFTDPQRMVFAGTYPAACGEKKWAVAYADPARFAVRAVEGLWRDMGGKLQGTVREGKLPTPADGPLQPAFEQLSPTLTEVVRDINKYSNNVMAQQLFLTLSLQQQGLGSPAASRALVQNWWRTRFGSEDLPLIDNGAGLSRNTRTSARGLARLLQHAWNSPLMPELLSSLPITGVDGTLKRSQAETLGNAHLKTGSLRDVSGVAGYVHAASGKRYVLIAIANHPNSRAMRHVVDALVDWTAKDN